MCMALQIESECPPRKKGSKQPQCPECARITYGGNAAAYWAKCRECENFTHYYQRKPDTEAQIAAYKAKISQGGAAKGNSEKNAGGTDNAKKGDTKKGDANGETKGSDNPSDMKSNAKVVNVTIESEGVTLVITAKQ